MGLCTGMSGDSVPLHVLPEHVSAQRLYTAALKRQIIWTVMLTEQVHDAGGNVTDSDDEADAVDGDGVPLFMWQALGDLGAPVPIPHQGPLEDHGPVQADEVEP